uniref:ATP synthase F0 subunit 8 n=1 Tax=Holothuria scabra TaxID=269548 RepID=A0A0U2A0S7_9ECHN|nr:ATP synthase F0 subunit 8 [Holothuria scabra]AKE49643.1 ATP synthase F0 subunit 8 [Holothuria scabra]
MPQLDLAWFLFNFAIAWSLVILVLSALTSQNWKQETNTNENITSTEITSNSQWQW